MYSESSVRQPWRNPLQPQPPTLKSLDEVFSLHANVNSVIYDSGSVPRRVIFSPREILNLSFEDIVVLFTTWSLGEGGGAVHLDAGGDPPKHEVANRDLKQGAVERMWRI